MCPECLVSAGWIVGGAMSSGGMTALLLRFIRAHGVFSVLKKERRISYGDSNERETNNQSGSASGVGGRAQGAVEQGEGVHAAARRVEPAAARTTLGES